MVKPIVMSDEDKRDIVEGWDFYYRFYTGIDSYQSKSKTRCSKNPQRCIQI